MQLCDTGSHRNLTNTEYIEIGEKFILKEGNLAAEDDANTFT